MAMPVIFVHGVTVRREPFDRLLTKVREGFANERQDRVHGFYWGDLGASFRFQGASIPGFLEGTRAVDAAAAGAMSTNPAQLMSLLLDDPHLELASLRDIEEFDPSGAGFAPLPPEVERRNRSLSGSQAQLTAALDQDQELARATGKPIAVEEFREIVQIAFEHAGRASRKLALVDLIDPLTRCLAASLYGVSVEQADVLATDFAWTKVESQVQAALEEVLGGQRNILTDALGNAALSAATFAMRHGLRRRLMQAMSLFVGDVLAYLANRDSILQRLEDTLTSAVGTDGGPLWLVGHSLGGIICCDFAYVADRDIDRLATVGSQVGLFGEWGALKAKPGSNGAKIETPRRVGNWLNIYDPDDMLSFLAEPVFTRVDDIEVDTRAPFPVSHSEYWNRPDVYAKLTTNQV